MERTCVALISGGLDSALAARLMLEQGIAVHGLFLAMSWGCCEKEKAQACAQQLGIPLMVLSVGDAYLDVIRNPTYGYGSGMNPCIDCRIYMFRIAKRYMEEIGAGFVVAAISFIIPALVETWIANGARPSIWWQVFAYVLITCAEAQVRNVNFNTRKVVAQQ